MGGRGGKVGCKADDMADKLQASFETNKES